MNYFVPIIICCFSLLLLAGCATPHVQMRTEETDYNKGSLGSFACKGDTFSVKVDISGKCLR